MMTWFRRSWWVVAAIVLLAGAGAYVNAAAPTPDAPLPIDLSDGVDGNQGTPGTSDGTGAERTETSSIPFDPDGARQQTVEHEVVDLPVTTEAPAPVTGAPTSPPPTDPPRTTPPADPPPSGDDDDDDNDDDDDDDHDDGDDDDDDDDDDD